MKASSLSLKSDVLPVAGATKKAYRVNLPLRLTAILILIVFLAGSLYLSASVSASRTERAKRNRTTASKKIPAPLSPAELNRSSSLAPMFSPQAAPPSIATYADDCTTPKTVFEVGETVCVSVSGIAADASFPRRLRWEGPNSTIVQVTDITTDPQTGSLPITATFAAGTTTVDSRGLWHVVVRNPFFFYRELT